jgi:uncharacterized protein DUF1573
MVKNKRFSWKHSSLLTLALLAGSVAGAAWAVDPPSGPAPMIEIAESTRDGGAVEEGTVVKFRFVVANHGKAPLEIPQVKPSCGCTVPQWDKLIEPGKEGVIEAEMRTIGFRGSVLKHLTVTTNDPQHPQLELTLTAKITPLVQVSPAVIALVTIEDQPVRQVFTLERNGGQPMKIQQVVVNQDSVKTELKPLSGDGRFELTATIGTDAPWGRTSIPITLRTDVEKVPNLTLYLIVDRGIVTTPQMVFFQTPPGTLSSPQQSLVTLMRQKGPFHVKAVSADDPKLEAKLEPVREGQEYRVTVSYTGGWDVGTVQRTLTITTDDPKQPEIKVPVHAIVQSPAVAR